MPNYLPDLDTPALLEWQAIRATEDLRWNGLLIGNGASIAVSDTFSYPSLYEVACRPDLAHTLSASTARVFTDLDTKNFEFVLGSFRLADLVCSAVGIDGSRFRLLYEETQAALFDAVAAVHVDWASVASTTLGRVRAELLNYRRVYTTNYDLLTYWAMMHEGDPDDFRDYFWAIGGPFDAANVGVWGSPTVVTFLHGGLHLRRTLNGGTFKRTAGEQGLLSQFHADWASGDTPLLVSEGTSTDKLRSINRSDYLSFGYSRFADHRGNLVVFGHGLGEEDDHLVHAIRSWGAPWDPPQIAISIRSQLGEQRVRQEKARLAQRLPNADIWFYDADTHPLGQPNVRPAEQPL